MAANKVNPLVKALQIPEGFTTRKVKGVLVVVKMRKAAIAKEKTMLIGNYLTACCNMYDLKELEDGRYTA